MQRCPESAADFWFLLSPKELDCLKVDITYSVHTHTSQNTLIQATVGLDKFKCMLGWSVCSAWHTLGQHEEQPELDFIKYGTTNLCTYKLYDSSPTDFCGALRRDAQAPASPAVAGGPSRIVPVLSRKSSSVGNWRVRQIWDGSEPAEVIKIWNIKLRC